MSNRLSIAYSLVSYLFLVLLAWYCIGVLLELLFPGFVSNYISLDIFLWTVIILGAFYMSLKKAATKQNT